MQSQTDPFQEDQFPGRPKILFIGLPASSHTHSWMRLLQDCSLNVRLFGIYWGLPPENWPFPTYITESNLPRNFSNRLTQSFYPWPETIDQYNQQLQIFEHQELDYQKQLLEYIALLKNQIKQHQNYEEALQIYHDRVQNNLKNRNNEFLDYVQYSLQYFQYCLDYFDREASAKRALLRAVQKRANWVAKYLHLPIRPIEIPSLVPFKEYRLSEVQHKKCSLDDDNIPVSRPLDLPSFPLPPSPPQLPMNKAQTPDHWLGKIIEEWKPDIIHTLGVFDGQGGEFYYRVRNNCKLEGFGKWVLQLRGGSDLTLRYRDPNMRPLIQEMLIACDQILTDNTINLSYAAELGIPSEKFPAFVPVPGTGGIDVNGLRARFPTLPSRRERILLVPKSYEAIWSKITPVLEALCIAWPSIQPCKIIFTAAIEETRIWIKNLPEEIHKNCLVLDRVNRQDFLEMLGRARVVLAPSLIDGIPNVLYEAMACGTFPIVSPLATIRSVVSEDQGLLFARNLYPNEIAQALMRAMNDDHL
ncbi:MAG TPA: glycosyltransferase family 4 protein, partial [Anaerovoracaceae bacterium]|nr:glycosyltransferase family 4 protein [Anaerovoracaceae bacterium]